MPSTRICPKPEDLVALWAGDLDEAEAAAIDEHLFQCDPCAATNEKLGAVVEVLRLRAGR